MADFFEIDFLDVESKKSGDAIAMRYVVNDVTTIHVTDAGYQDTGERMAEHIKKYYNNADHIHYVVATHPDGDHAGGLRYILENFSVGELWMLRPWLYAAEIIHRFERFNNVENLKTRLKEIYPNIAALEEIAERRGIPIRAPFQGSKIGEFTVMTPSKQRYLDLVIESDKTPESAEEATAKLASMFGEAAKAVINFMKSMWGEEIFSPSETSAENEMSVVQFAKLHNLTILLTADTGRAGLTEAAEYAPHVGLQLPGIHRFQVPHHGSRRNVSTEALDRWLGPRLANKPAAGSETFHAIISSAKADADHPRKAVVRAMIHRGAAVYTTEDGDIRFHHNAPNRGWRGLTPAEYPEDQEE